MFNTPILVLIFNRPAETERVFNRLRALQPSLLFVAADGPRSTKDGEFEKTQQARAIFEKQIDWPCTLKTLYREDNLGCRNAVSSAISWFFEQVEYGIILEDDCTPDLSFFQYCSILLEKYSNDERVMHIGGYNHFGQIKTVPKASYAYIQFPMVWGWASWRRAWAKIDLEMSDFPKITAADLKPLLSDKYARAYILDKWRSTYRKENDSWAYVWAFSILMEKGLCIFPTSNLIENIGINEEATHTNDGNSFFQTSSQAIEFPLIHPPHQIVDLELQQKIFYASQKSKSLLLLWYYLPKSLRQMIKKLINR